MTHSLIIPQKPPPPPRTHLTALQTHTLLHTPLPYCIECTCTLLRCMRIYTHLSALCKHTQRRAHTAYCTTHTSLCYTNAHILLYCAHTHPPYYTANTHSCTLPYLTVLNIHTLLHCTRRRAHTHVSALHVHTN